MARQEVAGSSAASNCESCGWARGTSPSMSQRVGDGQRCWLLSSIARWVFRRAQCSKNREAGAHSVATTRCSRPIGQRSGSADSGRAGRGCRSRRAPEAAGDRAVRRHSTPCSTRPRSNDSPPAHSSNGPVALGCHRCGRHPRQVASKRALVRRGETLRPSISRPRSEDVGYLLGRSCGREIWAS
jgi:hypothetical protein